MSLCDFNTSEMMWCPYEGRISRRADPETSCTPQRVDYSHDGGGHLPLTELQDGADSGSSALLLRPLRRDFKMVAHQSRTIEFANYLHEQTMDKPEMLRELFEALNGWLRACDAGADERESIARFTLLATLRMIRDGI